MNTLAESIGQTETAEKTVRNTGLILSATLFAIVCAVSAFLFFENMRLSSVTEANKNELSEYTNSIAKLRNDKRLIASELVANNKSEILSSIKASEAQIYVDELLRISKKYKMMFSGFSYENGKITTSAVSVPETVLAWDDGVKKISSFVRDYREGSGSTFLLAPVLSVSGYEQKRTFNIEFSVSGMPKK